MSILEICIVIMEEVSAVSTEVFFFFFFFFVISMQGLMNEGEICNLKESNYSDLRPSTLPQIGGKPQFWPLRKIPRV